MRAVFGCKVKLSALQKNQKSQPLAKQFMGGRLPFLAKLLLFMMAYTF
jgi:hypothetical protein